MRPVFHKTPILTALLFCVASARSAELTVRLDAPAVVRGDLHELLLEKGDYYRTLSVAYSDGPRWPHLMRVEGRPDIAEVVRPRSD